MLWDKCLYKDEFFNAGIEPSLIKYAYTDKGEFIAVAAQGDASRYSPEFKELLVKLGLPEYVLKMKPNSSEIIDNANCIAKIKQKYPEIKTPDDLISHFKARLINLEDIMAIPYNLASQML